MEAANNSEQNLSFEKVWQMFKETDLQFKETDRKFNESIQRCEKENSELKSQMKETDRKIKKISELYGNVSNNNGDVAENFFYRGLKQGKTLGGIQFHFVDRKNKIHLGNLQAEFDIILTNTDTVAIVEVKYKVHPNDIEKLKNNIIPVFKQAFLQYSNYNLYGVIAGFDIPEDCIQKAKDYGFFILTQSGKNMEIVNEENIIIY